MIHFHFKDTHSVQLWNFAGVYFLNGKCLEIWYSVLLFRIFTYLREREKSSPVGYCNGQLLAWLKPQGRSILWVSHLRGRGPSSPFVGALRRSWMAMEQPTEFAARVGCWCHRWMALLFFTKAVAPYFTEFLKFCLVLRIISHVVSNTLKLNSFTCLINTH